MRAPAVGAVARIRDDAPFGAGSRASAVVRGGCAGGVVARHGVTGRRNGQLDRSARIGRWFVLEMVLCYVLGFRVCDLCTVNGIVVCASICVPRHHIWRFRGVVGRFVSLGRPRHTATRATRARGDRDRWSVHTIFKPRARVTMEVAAPSATVPKTLWSQRKASLRVRFDVANARDIVVDVERAGTTSGNSILRVTCASDGDVGAGDGDGVDGSAPASEFSESTAATRAYAASLELYGSVRGPNAIAIKRTPRNFALEIPKTTSGAHWPRLLLTTQKFRHVATDFDSWLDEDDEDAQLNAFKFNLSSLEKISNYEDKEYLFPDVDDDDDDMPDMTDWYD